MEAMAKLLQLRNFNQITVNDLCEEAQISRATFYSHFADKYDLLKHWMMLKRPEIINQPNTYEDIEKSVNDFVDLHAKTIKNILEDANSETSELLRDFILSLLELPGDKSAKEPPDARSIVFAKFCAGGIFNYLLWQMNNKFPAELPVMNRHFYNILEQLLRFSAR